MDKRLNKRGNINNGVIKKEGEILLGSPAFNASDYKKVYVHFKNLPKLVKRIDELEKKIKELEK